MDEPGTKYKDHDFELTPLGINIDKPCMKMLKKAYHEAENKNIVTSPVSLLVLLSMYSAGVDDEIRSEIDSIFETTNHEDLWNACSAIVEKITAVDPRYLNFTNKILLSSDYDFENEFSDTVNSYGCETERIDFLNPNTALGGINYWAQQKTKGKIKKAFRNDSFDKNIIIALINVIFYQVRFHVLVSLEKKYFYPDNTIAVKKDVMSLQKPLFYYDSHELEAKMVELPIREKGFRMVIILPHAIEGLATLLKRASKFGVLSEIFKLEPSSYDFVFFMPIFEINADVEAKNMLSKAGIVKIYTDPAERIAKDSSLRVSKTLQSTFVKVNDEGCTSGAFTGFMINSRPQEFFVDHPFMFVILHEDIIMFVGTYTG